MVELVAAPRTLPSSRPSPTPPATAMASRALEGVPSATQKLAILAGQGIGDLAGRGR